MLDAEFERCASIEVFKSYTRKYGTATTQYCGVSSLKSILQLCCSWKLQLITITTPIPNVATGRVHFLTDRLDNPGTSANMRLVGRHVTQR